MADTRPLLFFDSGVGGLSVLAPARALLPAAPLVYAADSAGFPYGTRSEGEIAARVPALLGRLAERYKPRLIVIACNTASTIALAHVRAALDVPIVGTVPAIKPAAEVSRTRVIGVLGTQALGEFVLTTMEGGVMQARTHRDVAYFDRGVAALRDHFDMLLARAARRSEKV